MSDDPRRTSTNYSPGIIYSDYTYGHEGKEVKMMSHWEIFSATWMVSPSSMNILCTLQKSAVYSVSYNF